MRQHVATAIAAFERTLITPSRFDNFLNGDEQALNEDELRGLKAFIKLDCKSCHDGIPPKKTFKIAYTFVPPSPLIN